MAATLRTKQELAERLSPEARKAFFSRCDDIEREFTVGCTCNNDPCMEGGCSVEGEDETCLQPIERAGDDYYKAIDAAFETIYADPRNRSRW
ncbi:MAG TPA: hypothetical protein VFA59_07270 [Vicinamibacterales bacterium]|nr:hypothetical protein [Vicinamibacterales bacterium]